MRQIIYTIYPFTPSGATLKSNQLYRNKKTPQLVALGVRGERGAVPGSYIMIGNRKGW